MYLSSLAQEWEGSWELRRRADKLSLVAWPRVFVLTQGAWDGSKWSMLAAFIVWMQKYDWFANTQAQVSIVGKPMTHDPEHSQGEQTPACHQWFGLEGVGPNLPSACRGVACWQRVTLLSYYAVLMWHSTFNLLGDALCKNWEIGETTYVMSWFKRSMRSCIVMCMFHLSTNFSMAGL